MLVFLYGFHKGREIFMTHATSKPIVVDRRFVLRGTVAIAGAAVLTPAAANAQRGAEPTGQTADLDLDGNNAVDVAVLNPGELVVVSTAGTFYGVLRRSADQIAAAQAGEGDRDPAADADRVVNEEYLVVDMACTHRGCQVGYSTDAAEPFACPCHRSVFDASGRVLGGPARSNLGVPPYEISGTVVTFT